MEWEELEDLVGLHGLALGEEIRFEVGFEFLELGRAVEECEEDDGETPLGVGLGLVEEEEWGPIDGVVLQLDPDGLV